MIIEKIIRKLKNKPDYKLESDYSIKDLYYITRTRTIELVRGFFLKIYLKKSHGLLFIGRNVRIRHAYQLSAGSNLILGDNVYINALSYNGIVIGDNVSIARNSILICTGVIANKGLGIVIGNGTGITEGAFLGGQGGITIGKNVIMGPGVKIFSENHNFSNPLINIKDQGISRKGVIIGDNCWLGAGAIILDGVTIGSGSVIAAGCVVTKSIPENSVVAGVPGKVLKNRMGLS